MNAPTTAKVRRNYGKDANGVKRPGVTTVIGDTLGWSKNALMWWAAKEAAKAAVQFIRDGANDEEAVDRARKAHVAARDKAADAGTLAHAYVETFLRTGIDPYEPPSSDPWDMGEAPRSIEERAFASFTSFKKWWVGAGYEVVHCELELIDDQFDYGGTIDYVLRRKSDGAVIVADLKSGKSVYDEVLVQLGAYSLLLDKHGTQVAEGLVIHMPAEGEPNVIPVAKPMLVRGAQAFASLLHVYKNRKALSLNLDDKGGVP